MVVITGAAMSPAIDIYNAVGRKKCSVPWKQGSIIGLGWTLDEDLLVITETGEVCLLSQ